MNTKNTLRLIAVTADAATTGAALLLAPRANRMEERASAARVLPAGAQPVSYHPSAKPNIRATMLQAPLAFEPNAGQTDKRVQFMARGEGYGLFFAPGEAVLSLQTPSPALPLDTAKGKGVQILLFQGNDNFLSAKATKPPSPCRLRGRVGDGVV